jgi:CRP/FNR family cyclic AMP-dependent transcriptional regulator
LACLEGINRMSIMESHEMPLDNEGVLLPALSDADRAKLLSKSRPKSYPKGMMIFAAGEPGSLMLLIESGRVEVSVGSHSGRHTILNQMGPGEVLGDLATLDGGPRSADAVAASDVTGRILTRQVILAFLAEHPDAAFALLQELCQKLRNLSDLYTAQALTEGPNRLARALLKLFDKWGEPGPDGAVRLAQVFTQSEIGDFASLARENVNRYMRAWSQQGWIDTDGRRLVLRDREALEDLAGL